MPSQITICNRALGLLGASTISSLTDATAEAKRCNASWATVLDACLVSHDWGFAEAKAIVAADSTDPIVGYAYRYLMPVSPHCLRVRQVLDEYGGKYKYRVAGRYIECDCEAPIYLIYTARITDYNQLSALFVEGMILALAAELAIPLTADKDMRDMYRRDAKNALAAAAASDSNESDEATPQTTSSWLDARGTAEVEE